MKSKALLEQKLAIIFKDISEANLVNELTHLVHHWNHVAEKYAATESMIYEWQNDMDCRKVLVRLMKQLPVKEVIALEKLLKPMDAKIKKATFEVNECIWGAKNEQEQAYNRITNWYYYRINEKIFETEKGEFTRTIS